MPPVAETVSKYLASDKLRKAKEWYSVDYSQYLPHIVAHRSNPKQLYCQLTRSTLPKIPLKVAAHVNGKKYKRLMQEAEEREKKIAMRNREKKQDNEGEGEDELADFWMPPGENNEESGGEERDLDSREEEDEDEESDVSDEEFIVRSPELSLAVKGKGKERVKGVAKADTTSRGSDKTVPKLKKQEPSSKQPKQPKSMKRAREETVGGGKGGGKGGGQKMKVVAGDGKGSKKSKK